MKSRRWLPFVAGAGALLALAAPCLGQRASNWRAYRAADGLPETPVASITIGPHGHLWVRHPYAEAIGWLDGYEIKGISAPSPGTSRVYESASGQLWTFSLDGLQRYQDKENGWMKYNIPEIAAELRSNILSPRSFYLFPLRQNHVLLLLPDGLIECDLDHPDRPQITWMRKASETKLQKFLGMTPARDGGLWISGIGGLAKLPGPARNLKPETAWDEFVPPEELQIHHFRDPIEAEDGVTSIAESQDGSRQIITHFDGRHWSLQETGGEKIVQAWYGPNQVCWAITPTSLLNTKSGGKQLTPDETVPARRFSDVALETNGVFWLATSDGLFRYAPLCWQTVADGPPAVNGFAEDRDERLWAGSASGLSMFQNEHWTNFAYPQSSAANGSEIRNVFVLTNGTVVCVTGEKLLQLTPASGAFVEITHSDSAQIKPLGMLKDGTLCVQASTAAASGARNLRLEIFDGSSFKNPPFPQPELGTNNEAQLVFAAPNGNIWLSTSTGIFFYHDKKWQAFKLATQPATSGLACMVEISDGKLWCGVEDKIWEFDGKSWTLLRAGFDRVNAFVKTADGSIWVASDNGIHRFFHGTWTANGVEEGLPAATPVRTIYEGRHGRIWAGTTRGLCLYHPDADPDPPKTYVQNLPERNNTVQEGAVASISFSGQDKWKYTSEDRLVYSYRLDGQEWSSFQEQRTVSFLDLPAGKHSFFVRSMDRNWNIDPKPAVLEFAVALPWYRETRLLLISSAGFAVTLFFAGLAFNRHRQLVRSYAEVEAKVELRTKQLEVANQELFHSQKMNALGTLAAGIAHDFNNILSIIKGSAQIIEDNLENPDKIRTRTDRIKTVVEQGAGIVKAMLGFSRATDHQMMLCDVNEILDETIKLLGDRFLREVEVQFVPSPALPQVPASKDFVQQILLNFIFNAADAMTERRHIILNAKESNVLPTSMALKPLSTPSYVFVSVKDFGSGISPEVMPRIFEPFFTTKAFSTRRGTGLGLSMAYELARQMECGLSVESKLGEGSAFTLIFPVRDLPLDEPDKNH